MTGSARSWEAGPAVRAALLAAAALVLAGCAPRLERFEYRRAMMGTQARIVLYAPSEGAALADAAAAFDRMDELNEVMSDWRDDSELMRLCARAGEGPVSASADLRRVLRRGQEITAATDGAFDMTVGPVVRLWRDARRTGRLPEPSALREALDRTGRDRVEIDDASGTVALARPGMQLDLGGIGKGFAADEALATLTRRGTPRALVEIGGDLALGAAPPGAPGWRITDADGAARPALAHVGVASSGDVYQHIDIDGVRYSHIVDPRTGLGLTHGIAVVITAPDATTADALASAASVLGRRATESLPARFPGCAVRFIEAGPDARSPPAEP